MTVNVEQNLYKTLTPANSDQKICSIDKTSSERKTVPVIQVIEAMTKLFTAGSDLSD